MKNQMIFAILIGFMLFVSPALADCVSITNNTKYIANVSTDLCEDAYANITVWSGEPNIVIDCNNSVILGDFYTPVSAISVLDNNVTVQNCDISGYNNALVSADVDGMIVTDNTFHNNSYYGVQTYRNTNAYILENDISDCLIGVYLDQATNSSRVHNNTIYDMVYSGVGIQVTSDANDNNLTYNEIHDFTDTGATLYAIYNLGNNSFVGYNTIYNIDGVVIPSYDIYSLNSGYVSIIGNYLYNTAYTIAQVDGIEIQNDDGLIHSINIDSNTITNTTRGMYIVNVTDSIMNNNYIDMPEEQTSTYMGIIIYIVNDSVIHNNTFYNLQEAIDVADVLNVNVTNNNIHESNYGIALNMYGFLESYSYIEGNVIESTSLKTIGIVLDGGTDAFVINNNVSNYSVGLSLIDWGAYNSSTISSGRYCDNTLDINNVDTEDNTFTGVYCDTSDPDSLCDYSCDYVPPVPTEAWSLTSTIFILITILVTVTLGNEFAKDTSRYEILVTLLAFVTVMGIAISVVS